MCAKKKNDVRKLLSIYDKQESNLDCFAYDDSNKNNVDCCQMWSNACGSGNVGSDCCCDSLCAIGCCGC